MSLYTARAFLPREIRTSSKVRPQGRKRISFLEVGGTSKARYGTLIDCPLRYRERLLPQRRYSTDISLSLGTFLRIRHCTAPDDHGRPILHIKVGQATTQLPQNPQPRSSLASFQLKLLPHSLNFSLYPRHASTTMSCILKPTMPTSCSSDLYGMHNSCSIASMANPSNESPCTPSRCSIVACPTMISK